MRSFTSLLLLASLTVGACNLVTDPDEDILSLPAILSTDNNYTANGLQQTIPDTTLLREFSQAYRGRFSPTLKNELVEYIIGEANRLKLNDRQLRSCLEATGQLADSVVSLPYRMEYAKFESQRVWIMEFTWGSDTTWGHYRAYVLTSVKHDTLMFLTCR